MIDNIGKNGKIGKIGKVGGQGGQWGPNGPEYPESCKKNILPKNCVKLTKDIYGLCTYFRNQVQQHAKQVFQKNKNIYYRNLQKMSLKKY